ncbi:hypothetical protein M0804_008914 [Polistes exclamans]|nr:hypothetical protein M0804_008914 [Polistes exclamans]
MFFFLDFQAALAAAVTAVTVVVVVVVVVVVTDTANTCAGLLTFFNVSLMETEGRLDDHSIRFSSSLYILLNGSIDVQDIPKVFRLAEIFLDTVRMKDRGMVEVKWGVGVGEEKHHGGCGLRYSEYVERLGVNTVAGDARPTQGCGHSG